MKYNSNIYKNPPLIESVFEIRFPGNLSIECKRDLFYNKIKNIFPQILIPQITNAKAPALEPYRFQDKNDSKGIMVGINKIAFYCKKYKGFEYFKEDVLKYFTIFNGLFKITKLNRIGLRYINMIPVIREKEILPFHHYLNIEINLHNITSDNFKDLSIILTTPVNNGNITTRIKSATSEDKTKEAIILDFDYSKEMNLNFKSIEKYLNESHKHTKFFFESLITKDYKKYMDGEVI